MTLNRPSFRYPFTLPEDIDPGLRSALEFCFNGVTNHEQAFAAIKPQLDSTAGVANAAATSTSIASGVSSFNSETGDVIYFPSLGTVNDQLGQSSYATQQSDNGAKIIVGDSGAVVVGLNAAMMAPWFAFIDNDSGAVVTLTPDVGTTLFGPNTIQPNGFGTIFFDGTNFWCGATGVMPENAPVITHEWLKSYDATTGAFTQTRPAYSDLSGPIDFETNGTPNGSQVKLNLVAGTNVTLTDDGTGDVTVAASGGSSVPYRWANILAGG